MCILHKYITWWATSNYKFHKTTFTEFILSLIEISFFSYILLRTPIITETYYLNFMQQWFKNFQQPKSQLQKH